jgi:hypothetical protein
LPDPKTFALESGKPAKLTARDRWNKASAEREKKHNEIELRRQAAAKQGREDMSGAISRLEKMLTQRDVDENLNEAVSPAQQAAIAIAKKRADRSKSTKSKQSINEMQNTQVVEQAIIKRILVTHRDMLAKFGPEKIIDVAGDVAYNVGDIGSIGSSDVSGWVKQVQQILGATA